MKTNKRQLILTISICSVVSIVAICLVFLNLILTTNYTISLKDLNQENTNENTIIYEPTNTIDNNDAKTNLYILAGTIKKYNCYSSEITGKVVSVGYTQNVNNKKYKVGDDYLLKTSSTSLFRNVNEQAYFSNNNIVLANSLNINSATFKVASIEDYVNTYGVDFRELSNYVLNDETITSAELVSKVENKYTFKYKIDTTKATAGYRVNMVKFGGLNDLPILQSCEMEVIMTDDWQPISIKYLDKYTVNINILGTISCTSTLTQTFNDINSNNLKIENEEIFKSKLIQK